MLYIMPENRGKRMIGNVRTFIEKQRNNESMKENANENLKIGSIFLMSFALSGALIASSFMSVNLLRPYTTYIIKKVAKIGFKRIFLLNSRKEK